ncbi:hypothetical protein JMJ77_0003873 [Colletotrichum scovillei]|uniref:Uncharacterized protein n=1 Tax=Colletotrichum scovillei TaxID=1209932 RepID=A0A9P7U6T0_9PEZI|nr:hypothetical protein JMJ77_0003873 [Colletotrichum scovillei]KAG7049122.1 hypothetical protein JMJ78_0013105 [Colletotrichum scovillei]KAG7063863.1 hypothetical protein JMJ76_0006911 [Colletotrichum scovillei]
MPSAIGKLCRACKTQGKSASGHPRTNQDRLTWVLVILPSSQVRRLLSLVDTEA